jgi:hypothetical protein
MLGASLPEDGSKAGFRIVVFFLYIYTLDKSKLRACVRESFCLPLGVFPQYAHTTFQETRPPTLCMPHSCLPLTHYRTDTIRYCNQHRENSRFIADNQSGPGPQVRQNIVCGIAVAGGQDVTVACRPTGRQIQQAGL